MQGWPHAGQSKSRDEVKLLDTAQERASFLLLPCTGGGVDRCKLACCEASELIYGARFHADGADEQTKEPNMTTNCDPIAEQYKRSKQQPWRIYIEAFTLMELIGDPHGKLVVDIGCGDASIRVYD